jgi:hypothetical protein
MLTAYIKCVELKYQYGTDHQYNSEEQRRWYYVLIELAEGIKEIIEARQHKPIQIDPWVLSKSEQIETLLFNINTRGILDLPLKHLSYDPYDILKFWNKFESAGKYLTTGKPLYPVSQKEYIDLFTNNVVEFKASKEPRRLDDLLHLNHTFNVTLIDMANKLNAYSEIPTIEKYSQYILDIIDAFTYKELDSDYPVDQHISELKDFLEWEHYVDSWINIVCQYFHGYQYVYTYLQDVCVRDSKDFHYKASLRHSNKLYDIIPKSEYDEHLELQFVNIKVE